MKILILSHKPPYPAIDGGCVAIKNMANNLLELGYEVRILSLSTFKHPFVKKAFPEGFIEKTKFKSVEIDTKLNIIDAFSNLVTSDSYNVSRFFSAEVEEKLVEILQQYSPNVVLIESLFMTPYMRCINEHDPSIKIVLRSHNLEYLIWQRHKDNSNNPLKKVYLSILVSQLQKYEFDILNHVDGIMAISHLDKAHYLEEAKIKTPLEVIPLGINIESENLHDVKKKAFFHLGAMDWEPNIQGMHWFLKDVWPLILEKAPDTTLTLGGKNIDTYNLPEFAVNKNVIIVPEVKVAKDFMKSNGIMLVPITIAGGIRIKIIEGMSYGVPVVSTTTGAEGINAADGVEIMIGEDALEMAEKALELLNNTELLSSVQENGLEFAKSHFDNELIKQKVKQFIETKILNTTPEI